MKYLNNWWLSIPWPVRRGGCWVSSPPWRPPRRWRRWRTPPDSLSLINVYSLRHIGTMALCSIDPMESGQSQQSFAVRRERNRKKENCVDHHPTMIKDAIMQQNKAPGIISVPMCTYSTVQFAIAFIQYATVIKINNDDQFLFCSSKSPFAASEVSGFSMRSHKHFWY